MRAHGTHLHQSADAPHLQHEGPCPIAHTRPETASLRLHGRHHSGTEWNSADRQRPDRSRSHPCHAFAEALDFRNRGESEGQFFRLGSPRVSKPPGLRVANRLRSIQRQLFCEANGLRLHRGSGRASSKVFLQRGADCLPQEARDSIRRTIRFRMSACASSRFLPPLTGLGRVAPSNPRLAPWAKFWRCSAASTPRLRASAVRTT